MIIGHIENEKEKTVYANAIAKGLDYIKSTNFLALPDGQNDLSDGIFATVQEYVTQPQAKRRPESHIKYIDIQYVAKGQEIIGYSNLNDGCIVEESLVPEKDLIFYKKVSNEMNLTLSAGMFAVFFPWDVHRPCVSKDGDRSVKKVVIKIPVELVVNKQYL